MHFDTSTIFTRRPSRQHPQHAVTAMIGAVALIAAPGAGECIDQKLTPAVAEPGGRFGQATGLVGDTAVIGARRFSHEGYTIGVVHTFERSAGESGEWVELTELADPMPSTVDDRFGRSVAMHGDLLVVGDSSEDLACPGDPLCESGAVYVFTRDSSGPSPWTLAATLSPEDAEAGQLFGSRLAMTGEFIAVSAAGDDDLGVDAGAVYVYQREGAGGDQWDQVAKLVASDGAPGDGFGGALDIDDESIIVGSLSNTPMFQMGAAYVFDRNHGGPDNWGEVTRLIPDDAQAEQRFGSAVAIHGDTALVGARGDMHAGKHSGAAYIFGREGQGSGEWIQLARLVADDADPLDAFGLAVALAPQRAVVHAFGHDEGTGAIYFFEAVGATWSQRLRFTPAEAAPLDFFGLTLAIDGARLLAAALGDSDAARDAGAVYVLDADTCIPCLGDLDGDGAVGLTDLLTVLDSWGEPDAEADLDGDGVVGFTDLIVLLGRWGACD